MYIKGSANLHTKKISLSLQQDHRNWEAGEKGAGEGQFLLTCTFNKLEKNSE